MADIRCELPTVGTMMIPRFWDLTPFSVVEINRYFVPTYCLHFGCQRYVKQATESTTLKMETGNSSETLVNLYRTTRNHILIYRKLMVSQPWQFVCAPL
jgi:hypothetical protein